MQYDGYTWCAISSDKAPVNWKEKFPRKVVMLDGEAELHFSSRDTEGPEPSEHASAPLVGEQHPTTEARDLSLLAKTLGSKNPNAIRRVYISTVRHGLRAGYHVKTELTIVDVTKPKGQEFQISHFLYFGNGDQLEEMFEDCRGLSVWDKNWEVLGYFAGLHRDTRAGPKLVVAPAVKISSNGMAMDPEGLWRGSSVKLR